MAVKRVGIVGSGIMGSGIAEVAAKAGFEVVLRSRTQDSADAMVAGLEKSLASRSRRGKLDDADRDAVLGRVRAGHRPRRARRLRPRARVDRRGPRRQEAPLQRARPHLRRPHDPRHQHVDAARRRDGDGHRPARRVCGIHFFNPAPMMALVEVVRAITTSRRDDRRGDARSPRRAARTRSQVKDQAGFIVNALLFPYLNNAVRLLDAGVATRDDIDAAMKGGCNFPMGPLELLDLVGLDTSLAILDALYAEFQDPNYAPAPLLRRMVSAERLGRKTGVGFYDYQREIADRAPRASVGAVRSWGECDRGGPTLADAHVLRALVGARVQRALPHQPGQGPDRPVGRVRPPDPDRLRPRPPAGPGRGRQGRRAGAPPRRDADAVRRHPARRDEHVDDDQRHRDVAARHVPRARRGAAASTPRCSRAPRRTTS